MQPLTDVYFVPRTITATRRKLRNQDVHLALLTGALTPMVKQRIQKTANVKHLVDNGVVKTANQLQMIVPLLMEDFAIQASFQKMDVIHPVLIHQK